MWYPVSLKIVNLFSHEDSEFEFSNNKTTLVSGVNKTDSNVQSNGSGKTSILDCISIALIGEPLRDISKKEIVRNGEKSGQCTLILKNNVLDKTSADIIRVGMIGAVGFLPKDWSALFTLVSIFFMVSFR